MDVESHDVDPVLHDFNEKREACTFRAVCGRYYILVAELIRWMISQRHGESGSQAACLLRAAYSRKQSPNSPTLPMDSSRLNGNGKPATLLIFAILLELDSADLIHEFLRHDLDNSLPIDLLQLQTKLKRFMSRPKEVESLAKRFNRAQWRYCPATFDLGMDKVFAGDRILPICAKEPINEKGGTADLWWIQVPEEFVSKELREAVASSRSPPTEPNCKLGHVSKAR